MRLPPQCAFPCALQVPCGLGRKFVRARFLHSAFQLLGAQGQVGAEPAQGLPAQGGPLGRVDRGAGPPADAGQRRGAGGVIAVRGGQLVGERQVLGLPRVGGEGPVEEAGSGQVTFLWQVPQYVLLTVGEVMV